MRLRPLVCALVCAAAEATASAPPLGSLLASAPPPAIAEALERLSAAPADSERLRALLNASPAVGGVSGLLEHTASRATCAKLGLVEITEFWVAELNAAAENLFAVGISGPCSLALSGTDSATLPASLPYFCCFERAVLAPK